MTSVLSWDCSKYCAYSFFKDAKAAPRCRTWVAEGLWNSDDYGPYFVAFEKFLLDTLAVFQPDILAWESPIVVGRGNWGEGRGNDENNIRRLIGIVSVAELVGARRNMRTLEVHNQTSKAFIGIPGRKPQDMTKGQYKDLMVNAMTNKGFSCADSHQADAAACGLVVYDMLGET